MGFEAGVKLIVNELDSSDTTVSYEIKLTDDEGNASDVEGEVTVKIPVPEGMKAEDAAVYVLNADGTYTKVDAELVDGVFVFTTTELGVYAVSTEKLDEVKTPDESTTPDTTPDETTAPGTTDPGETPPPTGMAIAIVPAVISAAVVMVTKRRNRK